MFTFIRSPEAVSMLNTPLVNRTPTMIQAAWKAEWMLKATEWGKIRNNVALSTPGTHALCDARIEACLELSRNAI